MIPAEHGAIAIFRRLLADHEEVVYTRAIAIKESKPLTEQLQNDALVKFSAGKMEGFVVGVLAR